MAKITLNNIGVGTPFQTALTTINANNDAIEAAWENNLSRDGTTPNPMQSNFDMNSNFILNMNELDMNTHKVTNLATPTADNDAVRLIDLTNAVASGGSGGGGGTPGGSNLNIQYNNAGVFGGLTDTQVTARINAFTSGLKGAVPASGGGTTNFLRADGAWAAPGGGGGGTPGGSDTQLQYNNSGAFGGITGATTNGTSVTLTSPTFVTPVLGTPSSGTVTNLTGTASININGTVGATSQNTGQFTSLAYSTTLTGTSTNASALAVGRQGATDPVLKVNANTASVVTGLEIIGAAAAAGVNLAAISSGTNENFTINAKGSGTITLGNTSTGAITLTRATTMSNALTYGGVTLSNSVTGTGSMVLSAGPTLTGTTTVATLSATTINAFTLGGTISGGGNQINNIVIGNTTPLAGSFTSLTWSTTATGTSTNASALAVGRQGATDPVLKINANTASVATGIEIIGAAAGGGIAVNAISSGTNENLTINAKGSGTINIGNSSTGTVVIASSGAQTNIAGTPGTIALRFANDNLTGLGSRTTLEMNQYTNSTETMRWTQNLITTFSTLSAASTLNSNCTRTIASAATPTWGDVEVSATTTTWSGSTNITGLIAKSQFMSPVLTASGAAISIANAATVYINGAPTASASGGFTPTLSAAFALYVAADPVRFNGPFILNTSYSGGFAQIITHTPTIASAASISWNSFQVSSTLTLTGTTTVANDIAMVPFIQPLITSSSVQTVSKASTVYIQGEPVAGGSTIVDAAGVFALKIASGNTSLPASSYINWGNVSGTTGYGFRDSGGTMQFKNSGGAWAAFGGGGGGSATWNNDFYTYTYAV